MEQNKQRIVVKVGTSTLTHNSGALDLWSMEHLVRTLADLQGMGHEVILVSSGAIAVGTAKLGLSERPKELRMKQAAAAVGQCRMMHIYDKFFSEYNRSMAQILLTGDDVEDPERAEHLSNTFSALLEMGVIPVVNENDSVSSAEIETGRHKVLGDNDTLSAIVAELCRADLLVLLSDIDGLYDADPKTHPEAKLLHQVTELTPEILEMAGGAGSWRGTGGMATKLSAARIAMEAGCDMVITNGWRWPAAPAAGGAPAAWPPSSPLPALPWRPGAIWSSPTAAGWKTCTASRRGRTLERDLYRGKLGIDGLHPQRNDLKFVRIRRTPKFPTPNSSFKKGVTI